MNGNGFKLPRGFVANSMLKNPPGFGARILTPEPDPPDPTDLMLDELARACQKAAAGLNLREPMPMFPRQWYGFIAWPPGWRGGV